MTTFFLIWYALGWSAVGLWCKEFDDMTWCHFLLVMVMALPAFLGYGAGALIDIMHPCPDIWRRK